MFLSNDYVWTKKRKLVFFLRIFYTSSLFLLSESLANQKLILSDVFRNTKTKEQVYRSMGLC